MRDWTLIVGGYFAAAGFGLASGHYLIAALSCAAILYAAVTGPEGLGDA